MSTPAHRRRHSPAVYRRRRLVLLLALVVVAAAVWLLIAQPWRGGEQPAPLPSTSSAEATPAASPVETSAGPTPAPTDTAPTPDPSASPQLAACAARDVTIEALTDQDTYAAGQNPQFSIKLTNTSGQDCTMNVGTTKQSFTVTSGADVWWRSTDCQTAPSDQYVTLTSGQTVTSAAPVVWDRTRSSVKSCGEANRPVAPGGGASYHLAVAIGGLAGTKSAQFLMN